MDTLVLLPGFVNFFRQAKHHSVSPGNLAATFLAFGNSSLRNSWRNIHVTFLHAHGVPLSYRFCTLMQF